MALATIDENVQHREHSFGDRARAVGRDCCRSGCMGVMGIVSASLSGTAVIFSAIYLLENSSGWTHKTIELLTVPTGIITMTITGAYAAIYGYALGKRCGNILCKQRVSKLS
ncbi:MAG: hypothetical protein P0S95_06685 [Rhabdochlamydiaceae bacterium]|nr:hypothetical protein [Candidatus Amphrikana amoebophyrae]